MFGHPLERLVVAALTVIAIGVLVVGALVIAANSGLNANAPINPQALASGIRIGIGGVLVFAGLLIAAAASVVSLLISIDGRLRAQERLERLAFSPAVPRERLAQEPKVGLTDRLVE